MENVAYWKSWNDLYENMDEGFIIIGKIFKTHGLRGAFRVALLTDIPDRFRGLEKVTLESPTGRLKTCTVGTVREERHASGQQAVLEMKEIDSIEEAESYVGGVIKIPRSMLATLPQDQYFRFDLIGLEVFLEDGRRLGILEEIFKTGSNDVFVVRDGTKEHLIPALKSIVKEVNPPQRRMVIRWMEGLIDDTAL